MKLQTHYTLECDNCHVCFRDFNSKPVILGTMVAHIKLAHPHQYKELAWQGRLMATSRNGMTFDTSGTIYFDYPVCHPIIDGWSKASQQFRDYWIMETFTKSLT